MEWSWCHCILLYLSLMMFSFYLNWSHGTLFRGPCRCFPLSFAIIIRSVLCLCYSFFLMFSNYYLSHVLFISLLIIYWRGFSIGDFLKRQDEDCLSLFAMHLGILTFSLSHTLLESRAACRTSLPISSDRQAFISWRSTIFMAEKNLHILILPGSDL